MLWHVGSGPRVCLVGETEPLTIFEDDVFRGVPALFCRVGDDSKGRAERPKEKANPCRVAAPFARAQGERDDSEWGFAMCDDMNWHGYGEFSGARW